MRYHGIVWVFVGILTPHPQQKNIRNRSQTAASSGAAMSAAIAGRELGAFAGTSSFRTKKDSKIFRVEKPTGMEVQTAVHHCVIGWW